MTLPLSIRPMGPPARPAQAAVPTVAAPNFWVPARAVRFLPRYMEPTIAEMLRDAASKHRGMGWTHLTWRTSREDEQRALPEATVGQATDSGECVVAVVPLQDTRLKRSGFAVFFGEVAKGSDSRDAVQVQCHELEGLGLSTDLWLPLPTVR
jgi:hypothetical protein